MASKEPTLKERIEHTLSCLIELDLWDAGRSADLETFQLGPRREVTDRHGRSREVGTYALHVSCAWHIIGPTGIFVASRDRYYPSDASGLTVNDADFIWDRPGANRCDERITMLFRSHIGDTALLVDAVEADVSGGVRLTLRHGYTLAVFPDDSLPGEHWRFLSPWTDTPHFVVTGRGLDIF